MIHPWHGEIPRRSPDISDESDPMMIFDSAPYRSAFDHDVRNRRSTENWNSKLSLGFIDWEMDMLPQVPAYPAFAVSVSLSVGFMHLRSCRPMCSDLREERDLSSIA